MNALALPKDAIAIHDGRLITTSHAVAQVFNKQHKNVLRAIESLGVDEEFSRLNFEPSTYIDERGKQQPMVEMSRDGFMLVVMGFTGPEAMAWKVAYIKAFNAMERALAQGAHPAVPQPKPVMTMEEADQLLGAGPVVAVPLNTYLAMKASARRAAPAAPAGQGTLPFRAGGEGRAPKGPLTRGEKRAIGQMADRGTPQQTISELLGRNVRTIRSYLKSARRRSRRAS